MYILYTQYQVLHSHTEDSTLDTFHENSDRGSTCGPFLSSLTGGSDRESAEKKFFWRSALLFFLLQTCSVFAMSFWANPCVVVWSLWWLSGGCWGWRWVSRWWLLQGCCWLTGDRSCPWPLLRVDRDAAWASHLSVLYVQSTSYMLSAVSIQRKKNIGLCTQTDGMMDHLYRFVPSVFASFRFCNFVCFVIIQQPKHER